MIPELQKLFDNRPAPQFKTLGDVLSGLLNIVFYLALFLAFFYLIWGAFAYILSQGGKEELAKARARLTWAIIGLIITLLAFFIAKFVSEILPPGKGGLPFQ
ncbi:hypothetical protein HYU95_03615 [Candidatus Daviesbacteria bacterium]|nr:hypothetical protein [Candidatus Daviesbacteria bacterium]